MEYHHLSKIAAAYPNKAVSRFATYKIRKSLVEQGLAHDEEVVGSLLLCRKCSQQLLPGINCDVSIEKSRKNYRNCAAYFCKFCSTKTRFNGIHKNFAKYDYVKKTNQKTEKKQAFNLKQNIEKEEKIELPNYTNQGFRTLNKTEKKKSLLETFFESTEQSNLYKIFHYFIYIFIINKKISFKY